MTPRIKVMAAVDLSEFSMAIVRCSAWLAMQLNAELVLISIINQRDLENIQRAMIGYEAFSYPDYVAGQERDRQSKMKELVESTCPRELACRYLVRNGIPYQEILDAIKSEEPQVMIVGTKGRSNLADVMVGSTARKLYRRATVPLLTIPAGYAAPCVELK